MPRPSMSPFPSRMTKKALLLGFATAISHSGISIAWSQSAPPVSERSKQVEAPDKSGGTCRYCRRDNDVRFPPKADMCSAKRRVRFGPKADIALIRSPRRRGNQTLLQVAAFIRLRAITAEVNITYTIRRRRSEYDDQWINGQPHCVRCAVTRSWLAAFSQVLARTSRSSSPGLRAAHSW